MRPCGITFDTKRHRLLVSTLGAEVFLHTFDPARQRWSLVSSMKSVNAWGMAYSASNDMLYAIVGKYDDGHVLVGMNKIDSTGAVRERISFSRPILAAPPVGNLQAVAIGDALLALLVNPPKPPRSEPSVQQCYVVNLASGRIEFACIQEVQHQP